MTIQNFPLDPGFENHIKELYQHEPQFELFLQIARNEFYGAEWFSYDEEQVQVLDSKKHAEIVIYASEYKRAQQERFAQYKYWKASDTAWLQDLLRGFTGTSATTLIRQESEADIEFVILTPPDKYHLFNDKVFQALADLISAKTGIRYPLLYLNGQPQNLLRYQDCFSKVMM